MIESIRLINWSLSDNIIRLKVPVGIAYGSDTELTEKLLLEAAKENPMVLQNPESHVFFRRLATKASI
jgi:potassium efflux system protein